MVCSVGCVCLFLSTLSLRRATPGTLIHTTCDNIISIHALLAESDILYPDSAPQNWAISIHALLAESDQAADISARREANFYPRSPCGERLKVGRSNRNENAFLSTLSLRRATVSVCLVGCACLFLSTLSLRRATRVVDGSKSSIEISIHALLAESDWWLRCWKLAARDISIHALLAESDFGEGD